MNERKKKVIEGVLEFWEGDPYHSCQIELRIPELVNPYKDFWMTEDILENAIRDFDGKKVRITIEELISFSDEEEVRWKRIREQ